MSEDGFAYLGWEQCGCLTLVIVDEPRTKREVATETGKLLRRGGTIERKAMPEAREALKTMTSKCPHKAVRA